MSEFFPAELAVVLNCGRGAAAHRVRRAWTFRAELPATRAAPSGGEIDERRPVCSPRSRSTPTRAPGGWSRRGCCPRRSGLSPTRLREQALALLLELDAAAVDQALATAAELRIPEEPPDDPPPF